MSDAAMAFNLAFFTSTFFIFRIFVCPYLWWGIFSTAWELKDDAVTSCLPWHFPYVVFVFGMFFNILNSYWGIKIILKILRKIRGTEKVKDNDIKKR